VCLRLSFSITTRNTLYQRTGNVWSHAWWRSNYLYRGHFWQVHGVLNFASISGETGQRILLGLAPSTWTRNICWDPFNGQVPHWYFIYRITPGSGMPVA